MDLDGMDMNCKLATLQKLDGIYYKLFQALRTLVMDIGVMDNFKLAISPSKFQASSGLENS